MGQRPGARKVPPRGWLALLLAVGSATSAQAAEIGGSQLTVARGEGALDCPDEAHFARQVAIIAGHSIEKGLLVQVEFGHRSEGLEATLQVSGPRQGRRTLTDPGPTCAALAEAVAVTIALLLDPQEKAIPLPPPRLVPIPQLAKPPVAPVEAPSRLLLGLGPALTGGLTAQPALGIALDGGLRPGRRGPGIEGGLLWLPARSFSLPDSAAKGGSGEVQVSLLAARAAGCWWLGGPQLHGAACAELGAGAYLASGLNYYRNQDSTGLWIGAGPGLRAAGMIGGPIGWGAGIGWLFPIHRHDFVVDRVGKAFEAQASGGWIVQVKLEAALW